eukprot:6546914-Karenia_brevis.AAC.1
MLTWLQAQTPEQLDAVPIEQTTPAHIWLIMKKYIQKDTTFKELRGVAPRGDMERKLQAILEDLDQ